MEAQGRACAFPGEWKTSPTDTQLGKHNSHCSTEETAAGEAGLAHRLQRIRDTLAASVPGDRPQCLRVTASQQEGPWLELELSQCPLCHLLLPRFGVGWVTQ